MNDVFISYSRRDKVFTQKIFDALINHGRDVWADWDDIPAASDWNAEIEEGIEKTNTVLFVLSPEWIKSNVCRKEMDYALKMGKRLVPILHIMPVEGQEIPPELAKLNWVYMREGDDFDKAFQTLLDAMDTDLQWVKTHTRIQVRALEWEKKNRSVSFALRGEDLTEGEQFIASGAEKSPAPTHLQSEYVLASRKDATIRQRQTLAGVTVALVVSIALSIYAGIQQREAERQAQIALARQLAAQAQSVNTTFNSKQTIATLLDIQSLKIFPNPDAASFLLNKNFSAPTISQTIQNDWVNSVAFSPDGRFVVSGSSDGTARVFEAATGKEVARMTNGGEVVYAAFSPDGRYVVSGGCEKFDEYGCTQGIASVWEAATGQEVARMMHDGLVSSVAFSADGKYVVSGGWDNTVRVWEAATGQEVAYMTHDGPVNAVAFSPDGKYVVSGGQDFTARVWETITGKEVARMDHDGYAPNAVVFVVFSPDGWYVVSGGCEIYTDLGPGCLQGIAHVWEATTGKEVTRITHDDYVSSVVFSPDGKYVVSGSDDFTARVWEAVTGKEVAHMMHDGPVNSVAFSPDGRYVVSGSDDFTARVWEAASGNEVARITRDNNLIGSVAFSPDGKYVVSGGCEILDENNVCTQGFASVWKVAQGKQVTRLTHNNPVGSVAFSPDGRYVASGGCEEFELDFFGCIQGAARVWETATGNEVARMTYDDFVTSVAFSLDGKYLAAGSSDGTTRVWEALSGKEIARIPQSSSSVAFSHNGKNIVAGSSIIYVWDIAADKEVAHITHDAYGSAVAFSPDDKYVVSVIENTIRVWEAATGKEVARMTHDDFVTSVAFSPDGKYVVSSGSWDRTARVWEAATGKEVTRMTHDGYVSSVTFSPDGKYVVSGSYDGTARVWEAATGKEIARMTHDDFVTSVAFSPDGEYVVSGGDNTARVWEAATGKEIARMTHDDGVSSVAFSPDGQYVVSGSNDSTARVWAWQADDLITNACEVMPRNLTLAEWQKYVGTEIPYEVICDPSIYPNAIIPDDAQGYLDKQK